MLILDDKSFRVMKFSLAGLFSGILVTLFEAINKISFFAAYDFWNGYSPIEYILAFVISGFIFGIFLATVLRTYKVSIIGYIGIIFTSIISYNAAIFSPYIWLFLSIFPITLFNLLVGSLVGSLVLYTGLSLSLRKQPRDSGSAIKLFLLPLITVLLAYLALLATDNYGVFILILHPLWHITTFVTIGGMYQTAGKTTNQ